MLIETIVVEAIEGLQTNCYLVADEKTRQGIVIDPGGSAAGILRTIRDRNVTIVLIVNTHGHFDHAAGNQAVAEATGAQTAAHPDALPLLRQQGGAALFGLRMAPFPEPARLLNEGDEIVFGEERLKVLHTPGHTPGCISLWSERHDVVFDGDLLFNAGIGRTDLPGGSYRQLIESIDKKILSLPAETQICPGHGPETSVAQERKANPFLITRPDLL